MCALKPYNIISHSSIRSDVWVWLSRGLCSGIHQAEMKMLAGALILSWGSGTPLKLIDCWQNSLPCSCMIEVFGSRLAFSQRLLLDPRSCSYLPRGPTDNSQYDCLLSSRPTRTPLSDSSPSFKPHPISPGPPRIIPLWINSNSINQYSNTNSYSPLYLQTLQHYRRGYYTWWIQ